MSEKYDTNQFGEVVRYNCGRLMGDNRPMTEYEEQLLNEMQEMQDNLDSFESLLLEKKELEKENDELKEYIEYINPVKHGFFSFEEWKENQNDE